MVKSMYAAVAGLRTHQAKMDVIGNNIANVNTFGFKKARASFRDQFYATMRGSSEADQVYGGGNPSQVGYGSSLSSIEIDFGTASGAPTGNGMDVMIDGNGFFLVGKYFENGLAATSYDTTVANLTQLNFTRIGIFNIDGQGWLVDSLRNHVYGYSEGLEDPAGTGGAGGAGATMNKLVDADGNALLEPLQVPWCYFDSNGKVIRDATTGLAVKVVWELDNEGAYAVDETLNPKDDPLDAGPAGRVAAGTAPTDAAYIAPMKLSNISIGDGGEIVGVNNDTEEVITLGKIIIGDVPNPNALENTSNGYYRVKKNTGIVTGEEPGHGSTGSLNAGRLEMANVDLAQEFTDMITTQRGFQANGRIITVTDEMLAELVNLKR